jgi:hypothetical protein
MAAPMSGFSKCFELYETSPFVGKSALSRRLSASRLDDDPAEDGDEAVFGTEAVVAAGAAEGADLAGVGAPAPF